MHEADPVLISIAPRYVEAVLAGEKGVEFRRRRPRFGAGTLLVLYATTPTCAVLGTARVTNVDCADADALWQRYGHQGGIDRRSYFGYLAEAGQPTAITLGSIRRLRTALPLTRLRQLLGPRFHPPQSYSYLRSDAVRSLTAGGAAALLASGI